MTHKMSRTILPLVCSGLLFGVFAPHAHAEVPAELFENMLRSHERIEADQMPLGSIDGRVEHISPDSTVRNDGQGYYKIHIATSRRQFERGQARYQLLPGVRVVASIQTGERTLVEYLLDPFLDSASDALRER